MIFLENLGSFFSVETTKIENTSFPYKTAISEANVNREYKVDLSQRREFCQELLFENFVAV